MTGTGGVTRWRKRPVTVEAVQWTGDNAIELAAFTGSRFGVIDPEDRTDAPELTGQVFDVLHCTWVGMSTGQWVIKGVRGEFYPCDDAVLAETYDPAGEDDTPAALYMEGVKAERARITELAAKWEQESDAVREQSVREGLHPALAGGHREANLLMQRAADLRAVLLEQP